VNDKLIELEIKDLAFNGKAVANNEEGKVVFLNGGLPGEKVLAEIVRSKPSYDDAVVKEIITKSDLRIDPPCPHFDICGGCTWQDLTYSAQLDFKQKQVNDCLERIGGLESVKVFKAVGSSELFKYRNKMEFSFNANEDKSFNLGLHVKGRFDKVFDVEKCYLQTDLANEIVIWLREFVKEHDIPVYDVLNHTGYMRFLVIREARISGDLMVNIVTNYGDIPSRNELIKKMKEFFPEIKTLVHNQNGQKSNIAVGEIEKILYGLGFIEEQILGCRLRIRSNTFFQTNSVQTETLYRAAFDMLFPEKTDRVMDLYCGTGSIGLLISNHVHKVIGVEVVEDGVEAARENAQINKIENVEFYHGDVKDFLRTYYATEKPFNIIIIDPPRAGMNPKALRRMLRLNPEKILYISCNPSTFARDAAEIVKAGFRLPEVKPIDMFPHTMHIEVVGVFYRE
jgi:23S rRNA (uracil1939-C5)-methyltransferase